MLKWTRLATSLVAGIAALLSATGIARAEDCSAGSYSSTFELIQKQIFEKRGCTESVCHGQYAEGGLDLRAEYSYDNLFDKPATTFDPKQTWKRVVPGRRDQSLLFVNLAAKTQPGQYSAPLRAMPLDPVPALRIEELDLIRKWIEQGAPRDIVVNGTGDILPDTCLPPPEPIAIQPLEPPAPGTGVQIRMPITYLPPHSEHEQCLASWFDITDQVPAEFRGPNGDTFRYKRNEIRQDPLSHHLIVSLYTGEAGPNDPAWGQFSCRGGEKNGQPCEPTDVTFCGEGLCSTAPVNSIACIGFGPQDVEVGLANAGFTGTQETASEFNFPEGVYREVPMRGMIIWNTHAFNLTDKQGKVEAWLNFEFAAPEEQTTPARQIFDTRTIFKMNVPAFQTQEICNVYEIPRNAALYELSSHAHQRMKRWRTFEGAFTCQGGPGNGQACSPLGYDFASPDVCKGAPCKSMQRQRVCDCDVDSEVTVDELVRSVNIALGSTPVSRCEDADANRDSEVTVDEIVKGVNAALNGVPPSVERNPSESLLYVSLVYNDPIVLRFDPPMEFTSKLAEERSLTYCGLYDNGFTDPMSVKRKSTSPNPPAPVPGVGGPCTTPTHCVDGKLGEPCVGNNTRQRNASCDSVEGAGDGLCDACTLTGGVTTEDEMFILMGQYYVP